MKFLKVNISFNKPTKSLLLISAYLALSPKVKPSTGLRLFDGIRDVTITFKNKSNILTIVKLCVSVV